MCSECDWAAAKTEMVNQMKKCDCGNAHWHLTSLQAIDSLGSDVHPIYRCVKCDALRSAEHLFF